MITLKCTIQIEAPNEEIARMRAAIVLHQVNEEFPNLNLKLSDNCTLGDLSGEHECE